LYPTEYIQFLAHFHGDRDYFECHEILEEYWKQTDSNNKSSIWVGLILLAVSTYHHRRSNFVGAVRTLEKALKMFKSQTTCLAKLGLNGQLFLDSLEERLSLMKNSRPYTSFNLPIGDPVLMERCHNYCQQTGLQWGKESDISNDNLIHRHALRDRSSVIAERIYSLKLRKGKE